MNLNSFVEEYLLIGFVFFLVKTAIIKHRADIVNVTILEEDPEAEATVGLDWDYLLVYCFGLWPIGLLESIEEFLSRRRN